MKIKIQIKTVEGQANTTQKKIQPFILGVRKIKNDVYCNKKDDTIIWVVEGQTRDIMRIAGNVNRFDVTMAKVLSNKTIRKVAGIKENQIKELEELLKNQTKVKILKSYDDPVDIENKSLWQKIKDKF